MQLLTKIDLEFKRFTQKQVRCNISRESVLWKKRTDY